MLLYTHQEGLRHFPQPVLPAVAPHLPYEVARRARVGYETRQPLGDRGHEACLGGLGVMSLIDDLYPFVKARAAIDNDVL